MLERIILDNFVSHKSSTVKFDPGVTVFVGRNGAGKSSVIDGITFALYGKHTRGRNRNLVRRGSSESMVQLVFAAEGKRYQATRTLDARGSLTGAKLEEITDSGPVALVEGERRQMQEDMSTEVGNIFGLDYNRLTVAAVVQQGELDAILRSKPSEFKELINTLIGIERLDKAFGNMADLIGEFRRSLREGTGYDDQDLDMIRREVDRAEKDLEEARVKLDDLNRRLQDLLEEEEKIKQKLRELEPLSTRVKELGQTEADLLEHVRKNVGLRRRALNDEAEKKQKFAKDALAKLEQASRKGGVRSKLDQIRHELDTFAIDVERINTEMGKREGLLECATYLQPVDGKCPVCGSPIDGLPSKFDVEHVREDLDKLKEDVRKKKLHLDELRLEEGKLVDTETSSNSAIQVLDSIGIRSRDDVSKIEEEVLRIREELARMPDRFDSVEEPKSLIIDDYSRDLADKLVALRKELKAFDQGEYDELKERQQRLINIERPSLDKDIGRFGGIRDRAEEQIANLSKTLVEVQKAYTYIKILEKIRSGVFNRDGAVAMSLRSWALRMISQRASEYIGMFSVSVSRLDLTEKAREVLMTCYGPRGSIDTDSLSGGEKVAIALALRLAMAYVMGRGKLDFIILDEPTTHLDEERRRSLVHIITQAFREGLGPLSQIVIITHDSEIFEDADVNSIYRFVIDTEGTSITRL